MTPALWITLIAVGAVVLSIASWWGVRKLGRKHNRSAVGEPAQPGPSGPQKVAVVLNPVKAQANQAKSAIRAAIADASASTIAFLSSIGNREAIAFGEAVATTMRMRFSEQRPEELPAMAGRSPAQTEQREPLVEELVARMRGL